MLSRLQKFYKIVYSIFFSTIYQRNIGIVTLKIYMIFINITTLLQLLLDNCNMSYQKFSVSFLIYLHLFKDLFHKDFFSLIRRNGSTVRSTLVWTRLLHCSHARVRFCHSGQTQRFRCCPVAAVGALEYPKTNSWNGTKEELYFLYFIHTYIIYYMNTFTCLSFLPFVWSYKHICTYMCYYPDMEFGLQEGKTAELARTINELSLEFNLIIPAKTYDDMTWKYITWQRTILIMSNKSKSNKIEFGWKAYTVTNIMRWHLKIWLLYVFPCPIITEAV